MQSVKQRLFSCETRHVSNISTILDPRFKKEGLRNVENAKLLDNKISFFINKNKEQKEVDIVKEIEIGTDVTSESISLFSFIQKIIKEKGKTTLADVIITKQQYFERASTEQSTDPLQFWKLMGNELNILDKSALKYLCVPGTSV
ncbi:unnamed protein product [Psylliodes chrysocephalus]|uniref:Uncharacterized protein n=1 Tax=Psylliodes chrysocephalus TaxID=3402493 RepID=A0A9P0CD76_9CUCU|nr:unnamed protein product [Psylliodes chrysocephala]